MRKWIVLWISVVALAFFPVLMGNLADLEDYSPVVSGAYHARALFEGRYPFWISELGLGIPHPFAQNFLFHPLLPLFGLLTPWIAIAVLYFAHALLASGSIFAICRYMGTSRPVSALGALTYILATPTLQYTLRDFWPTEFTGWTIAPLFLYLLMRFLDEADRKRQWVFALLAGTTGGLLIQNGHMGHVPVFPLAFAVFVISQPRKLLLRWRPALLLTTIALIICAPKVIHLLNEYLLFDRTLEKSAPPSSLTWVSIMNILLYPYRMGTHSFWQSLDEFRRFRVVGFGGSFACLAALAFGMEMKRRFARGNSGPGFALGLSAIFSLFMISLSEDKVFRILSETFLFRDPLIIAAIPLAALALERISRWNGWGRWIAVALGALQLTSLTFPHFQPWWELVGLGLHPEKCTLRFLNPADDSGLLGKLRAEASDGSRLYFGPQIDSQLQFRQFCRAGIYSNSLAIDGIRVVNGFFKGVSTGAIHPDQRIPYGEIKGQESVLRNLPLLQVLNIRHILRLKVQGMDPPPGMEYVETLQEKSPILNLYRVRDTWPDAVFIADEARSMQLKPLSGCGHDRLLCSDFSPVLGLRRDAVQPIEIKRDFGRVTLKLSPSDRSRTVFLSEMYRPDWKAWTSGAGNAEVFPLFGSLVGVQVQPGVSEMTLEYRPTLEIITTWMAWITLILSLGAAFRLTFRWPLSRNLPMIR